MAGLLNNSCSSGGLLVWGSCQNWEVPLFSAMDYLVLGAVFYGGTLKCWGMKQKGTLVAENTSTWKEVESRGDLGVQEMVFGYLKGCSWDKGVSRLVLLQRACQGQRVEFHETYFISQKGSLCLFSYKKHFYKRSDLSLKVFKHWPSDHAPVTYCRKHISTSIKVEIKNFSNLFLLLRAPGSLT